MSAARLYRVQPREGGRTFCGPYALAALTGRPVATWEAGGMDWIELRNGLVGAGLSVRDLNVPVRTKWYDEAMLEFGKPRYRHVGRPMLWQVLRPGMRGIASFRMRAGYHAVAFSDYLVDDNATRGPRWVHDHPCGKARVRLMMTAHAPEAGAPALVIEPDLAEQMALAVAR